MNQSPFLTLVLGVGLLGTGFLIGYGFQSRSAQQGRSRPLAIPTPTLPSSPPLVRGLHASPNGNLLAWTGIWDRSSHAGVWVFNTKTKQVRLSPSPAGWQDLVAQWRSDGHTLLVDREKIPRVAAEAKAGLFQIPVDTTTLSADQLKSALPNLPNDEKLISGAYTPDGALLVKTRREPKSLFLAKNGQITLLDRAALAFGQNRAVLEKGRTVIYAVRDLPDKSGMALFRISNGRAQQLTSSLADVTWSYVSPQGRYLVVARNDSETGDYVWSLYAIEARSARLLRTQTVTGDAISVYWSPDEKQILGAAGKKLWNISIPTLKVTQIGTKTDWDADDATWLGTQNTVVVAANGELWRVNVATGQAQSLWKFPPTFWD